MNEPAAVLRGIGGKDNHWLGVRLDGKDHACVVGARAVWEATGSGRRGSPRAAAPTPRPATGGCCSAWATRRTAG